MPTDDDRIILSEDVIADILNLLAAHGVKGYLEDVAIRSSTSFTPEDVRRPGLWKKLRPDGTYDRCRLYNEQPENSIPCDIPITHPEERPPEEA
jgi:hypothetical protein